MHFQIATETVLLMIACGAEDESNWTRSHDAKEENQRILCAYLSNNLRRCHLTLQL